MKITPKFQRGGQFSSYFTVYTPLEVPQPSQKTVARPTTSSNNGKLTEKDLFDMIKDIDGLPNDMQSIVGNLLTTFQWNNLTGTSTSDLATTYLQNIYQIKLAKQNKEYYDEALKNAYTNGSLSEPAITSSGDLVVQKSDGSISSVSIETYMNNQDKLHPLTVSNLADMRKFDPQLVGNSTIFSVINTSIGFQNFQNLIKDAVKTLGTTEYSREGMFSNEGQASKGLDLLRTLREDDRVQAMGSVTAEGLYKYKIIDKDQKAQIDALSNYILALLPNNVKTWAAFKLKTSDKNQATRNLIVSYLASGSSASHQFGIDYEGSMDKVIGNKKSSSSEGEEEKSGAKMTFLTALQNGYGGRNDRRSLNFGNNTSFSVTGTSWGSVLDYSGKPISNLNLQDLLTQTGIGGITNPESITFGDNVLNANSLSKIAVQNTGGFWAILPCIKKGNAVVPNFQLINQYNNIVQEVIEELGDNATPEQKKQLLESKLQKEPELQELLDMSGKLDPSKVQAFFIVDGLASNRNFTFTDINGKEISGNSNPLIWATNDQRDIDYFKTITGEKDFDDPQWYNPFDAFGLYDGAYDTLYKSKVFIPIQTTNRLAAVLFSGQKISDESARALEGEYQRQQITSKMNKPSSEYLYK